MNTVALKDFKSYAKVNDSVINKFKSVIPEALLLIWKNYGLGTFMNGYIKVINPDDYLDLFSKSQCRLKNAVPIFATAFGDIITCESGEYISILYYRYDKIELMLKDFNFFLNRLNDNRFLNEFFSLNQYNKAINKYGNLRYRECFGYTPLLSFGEKEDTLGLKKIQIQEHIALIKAYSGEFM